MMAAHLPTICNINPRSLYNKVEEFCAFIKMESVDVVFVSETWEREELPLKDIIWHNDKWTPVSILMLIVKIWLLRFDKQKVIMRAEIISLNRSF